LGRTKEVDRDHLADMVVQEGLPGLPGPRAEPSDDTGHGTFREVYAEHLQFAMHPRRAPQRISGDHSLDQLPDFGGRAGPTPSAALLL
jgi:hypothetical protein